MLNSVLKCVKHSYTHDAIGCSNRPPKPVAATIALCVRYTRDVGCVASTVAELIAATVARTKSFVAATTEATITLSIHHMTSQ